MSHDTLNYAERIRAHGYRLTPQRELILDAICAAGGHTTIDEIYERVQEVTPSMNLATVYRTVNFFCELQLVVSAEIEGQTVYEIARPIPHHHLVCRECGAVIELPDYHFDDLAAHLRQEHGFVADIRHLVIPGRCAQCAGH